MAEVMKPIEVSDLNGVSLNPQDLSVDQLVGYTGFIRGLVSTLGTEADTEEGYADYVNFQKEIEAARISTFEPDMIDDDHSFDEVDLLGENDPIPVYENMYYAYMNNMMFMASILNNGKGWSPWDVDPKDQYAHISGKGISPFDLPQANSDDTVYVS